MSDDDAGKLVGAWLVQEKNGRVKQVLASAELRREESASDLDRLCHGRAWHLSGIFTCDRHGQGPEGFASRGSIKTSTISISD